jgi:hypothetical protein
MIALDTHAKIQRIGRMLNAKHQSVLPLALALTN